jgi:predicted nucleic acid-binding protein
MTPDVNVLVAVSRSDHPHHGPALTWLDAALDDCEKGRALAIFPMVAARFLRLVTYPKVFVQPTPADAALAFLRAVLNSPGVEMPRLGGEWPLLERLCKHHRLTAKAVMSHHDHLVSFDMEIEFKSNTGEATGRKLYLQLKSGDSYLRQRKGDGAETFKIKDERHARYWMAQAFPVLLVIRNSEGEVRWMEVRDWLKRASDNGKNPVKQIVFAGERLDVMSVRRWRDRALRQ